MERVGWNVREEAPKFVLPNAISAEGPQRSIRKKTHRTAHHDYNTHSSVVCARTCQCGSLKLDRPPTRALRDCKRHNVLTLYMQVRTPDKYVAYRQASAPRTINTNSNSYNPGEIQCTADADDIQASPNEGACGRAMRERREIQTLRRSVSLWMGSGSPCGSKKHSNDK